MKSPMKRFLACALALAAASAGAQSYQPTPVNRCDTLGALRVGPERGSPASPLAHELAGQLAEARAFCEQAVLEQPREARLHAKLARLRALSGDGKGALEAARRAAELGSPSALTLLGVMQADGELLPRDYAAARASLQRAAKAGEPHAHFNLGVMSANGWGVEADDEDAAAALRRAAAGGDPLAMQLLGQRYDPPAAADWLKKAAEALLTEPARNPMRLAARARARLDEAALAAWYERKARAAEPWAQAYVGLLHEAGQWLAQDYAAAARWYRAAGEAGHVPAQWRLARLYREGRGVPRDTAEARRWGQRHQLQACEAHEREAAGANACDRFAAERYDTQRVSPGVDSFCMRHFAERAVAACTQAVKAQPATVRYRAQLARALAHTGRLAEARREAAAAAAAGSASAMVLLGAMQQRGLGGPADEAAAAAWYRKAGEAGNARGASLAGIMVAHAAPDPAAQARAGDARAQHNLAWRYEQEKNYPEAMRWYARAAAQGLGVSAMNLAQMYEKGIGVEQDVQEAMRRYRRLAAQGDGESRYRLARLAAEHGEPAEAVRLYERGVRDDDHRAMLDLGELYEHGRRVKRDVRRAVGLYERAAERSGWARFKIGTLYLQGEGIPADYAKALAWLRRSAGEGHPGARNNLGQMYERGLGVPVDYATARDLYLAAMAAGNLEAHGNLERFYAEGRGAPGGKAHADRYRGGAEAGVVAAQVRLGRMYAKGENAPRDEREAVKWLAAAARQGHPEARKEAAELYYKLGDLVEAMAYGHPRAEKELAARLAAASDAEKAEYLKRMYAAPRGFPPPIVHPAGITRDAGEDRERHMAVRVAGMATAYAAAGDAAIANVYDIVRWFPETDGKPK